MHLSVEFAIFISVFLSNLCWSTWSWSWSLSRNGTGDVYLLLRKVTCLPTAFLVVTNFLAIAALDIQSLVNFLMSSGVWSFTSVASSS